MLNGTLFLAQAAAPDAIMSSANWPLYVLGTCVLFIIVAIGAFRMHAFLALVCAALLAGMMTAFDVDTRTFDIGLATEALGKVSQGFGNTAAGVALVIALASIIGMCLMDSGAADQIVRKFMSIFGEKRAAWALLASGFFLSIPVFFDTVFFLLIPLARMLGIRTGKNYLLYVMAIGGGGAITHSIVPPTPGPLLVGDALGLNLGTLMVVGFVGGIIPAIVAVWFAKLVNRWMPIPVRETPGSSLTELESSMSKSDDELPSFALSVLPILLPALMLAGFSVVDMMEKHKIGQEITAKYTILEPAPAAPEAEAEEVEATPLDAAIEDLDAATNVVTNAIAATDDAVDSPDALNIDSDAATDITDAAEALVDDANDAVAAAAAALDDATNDTVAATDETAATADVDPTLPVITQEALKAEIATATSDSANFSQLHSYLNFFGNKVVALGLGAFLAMLILLKQCKMSLRAFGEKSVGPLETAAVIILITSAGGAFGFMIRESGVGVVIQDLAVRYEINYILLAWAVTAIVRIAQGSATVSMITGSGLMAGILFNPAVPVDLPYHELYIFLAIGFGSITCSWMNDSGFWIVGKLSGMSERETLKSWTPQLTLIAVVGLGQTLLCAKYLPLLNLPN